MLADENPEWGNLAPPTLGGTTVRLHLYVDDVDAVFARALAAGAKEIFPVPTTAPVGSKTPSGTSGS
jgi:PhnB protein